MNDRRHELQTNELAVYLQKINRSVEPYSKQIAVVLGLLIVGGIAYGLYRSKVSGDRSDATLQLIQAVGSSSAEQLATVGDNYPDTAPAAWSRLYEGNAYMAEGLRALYVDREDAEARLGDARDAFNQALSGSDDRLLRSRGYFGLARVAESLGEIDEAIGAYRKCVEADESEAMVDYAQGRIDALSNPQTKEFLAWFSEQDFTPADPSLPPSLPSEKTLPDMPDLNLPTLGEKLGVSSDDSESGEDTMKLEDGEGLDLPNDADVNAEKKTDATQAAEKSDALSDPAQSEAAAKKADAAKEADAAAKKGDAAGKEADAAAKEADAAAKKGEAAGKEADTVEPEKTEVAESSDADKE